MGTLIGAESAKKPRRGMGRANSRLLRRLMDQENQEIQRRQMEEQKRLMQEASRRCQMTVPAKEQRSFVELLPEVERIARKLTNNYVDQHPEIAAQIKREEAKPVRKLKPLGGVFKSIFSSSSLSLSSLSLPSESYSSYLRFQLEEMFKVLVLPEKSLEEYFSQMSQTSLKKEFKKMALLLHPDKNIVSYSKIAFQKVFAVYEKCKC